MLKKITNRKPDRTPHWRFLKVPRPEENMMSFEQVSSPQGSSSASSMWFKITYKSNINCLE